MNTYSLLGGLLIMAGLGSWATLETGRADEWKGKYDQRVAQEQTAADAAKADAQKQEQKDLQAIQSSTMQALQQAQAGQKQAQDALQIYLAKGNAASRGKVDLAHQCFDLQIPAEDIP